MFSLRGVAKRYGPLVALERTDLDVPPGETLVLIGPSGSGKSTLLRLLVGLDWPDEGTVSFGGRALTRRDAPALRRRMGYVVQGGGLFPHLTARENAALPARVFGWDHRRVEARLDALTALTRFPPDGLKRYPAELSGGQSQRVGLMRALMLDPDVLLLDEPLGALDPITRYELQVDLRAIFGGLHKTVVLVTHDLGEAAFFADRIILLRSGRVVQQGALADLLHRPAEPFVSQFISAQRSPMDALGTHG
jgi:osmoprotectant transport system ATP-binding protein